MDATGRGTYECARCRTSVPFARGEEPPIVLVVAQGRRRPRHVVLVDDVEVHSCPMEKPAG